MNRINIKDINLRKMAEKVAIVTGSNRGLGLAIVRGLCERLSSQDTVYLTARDPDRGHKAVQKLNNLGLHPAFHHLDVNNRESVQKLANDIKEKHGGIDYLVNNAAIMDYDVIYPTYEGAKKNIEINYKSLLTVEEFLYPLLRDGARVVNISSACGHLSNLRNERWIEMLKSSDLTQEQVNQFVDDYLDSVKNGTFRREDFADNGKHAEHRVSKIAVTATTMIQANKYASRHISINAVHPGHLDTDMAMGAGVTPPEDAASIVLYLLLDASPNLTGTFMWHDRKLVDWYDHEGDYYYVHKDVQ